MSSIPLLLCLAGGIVNVAAVQEHTAVRQRTSALEHQQLHLSSSTPNPIRIVITFLEDLVQRLQTQTTTDDEEYHKFMCKCHLIGINLTGHIDVGKERLPLLISSIEELMAYEGKLTGKLADYRAMYEEVLKTLRDTVMRHQSEVTALEKSIAEYNQNLIALNKSIVVLSEGLYGKKDADATAFLQSSAASDLKRLSESLEMSDKSRDALVAFLSQDETYEPGTGEIIGILKQLEEDMKKDLDKTNSELEELNSNFGPLVLAKEKEKVRLEEEINEYLKKQADAYLKLHGLKDEKTNTENDLADDEKSLAWWIRECKNKVKTHQETMADRSKEIVAIQRTIELLSSDTSLELFKRAVPSASASFLQLEVTSEALRARALDELRKRRRRRGSHGRDSRVDLIEIALRGGKTGFDRLLNMIDELVETSNREQDRERTTKNDCKKDIPQEESDIEIGEQNIKTNQRFLEEKQADEAKAKEARDAELNEIAILDANVVAETKRRQNDNIRYISKTQSARAAVKLLQIAINKLDSIYNPEGYNPAIDPDTPGVNQSDLINGCAGAICEQCPPDMKELEMKGSCCPKCIPKVEPPLACPEGTEAVEGGNGIEGCGLTSCSARYQMATVDECASMCALNSQCKAFSFAPVNGNQDHMDSPVCSFYSSDLATLTIGPKQIMCKHKGVDPSTLHYCGFDQLNTVMSTTLACSKMLEATDKGRGTGNLDLEKTDLCECMMDDAWKDKADEFQCTAARNSKHTVKQLYDICKTGPPYPAGFDFLQVARETNMSFVQIHASHSHSHPAMGAITMMNNLITILSKDMSKMKVEEKNAQEDYEEFIQDSDKQKEDRNKALEEAVQQLTDAEREVAKYAGFVQQYQDQLEIDKQELEELHKKCDFIMAYYDVRKKARQEEIEALLHAKAVLSGSPVPMFIQTRRQIRALRGHRSP